MQQSVVLNPWNYRFAPCHPETLNKFLRSKFGFSPEDILLEDDDKTSFSCVFSSEKRFVFNWDGFKLYFSFGGYKKTESDDGVLRKARAFFSGNLIYPIYRDEIWIFSIDRNYFIESYL